ncbi:probable ATP-dependent RNA helicase DDX60 isoform X2 [Corapipo altera]|uniref:probable ATP-dependent RNA helicase DDX60 isoform X2 n=1 Tax=Corapipo altera TaxID=415028 RepID=UPI000FD65605|nr:probable ATP-dependent RNA helicase DDX60 isoform X2 [Corapipo altera]XP_027491318.1 probable ATP-dependent RNA helicase DDX60 isoform X2 [Corapipo altera]XP_027491319.1 probable ATP-dependent RNA helicase DDX60 isoform X2 [Corapipo altera]
MASAEYHSKKVVNEDTNESNDDMDSVCSDSEKMGFIATKEDEDRGSTIDVDEEDKISDKVEAAVLQTLKKEVDREKEVNNIDYSSIEEVKQEASQTEDEDFRVVQHEHDSQSHGMRKCHEFLKKLRIHVWESLSKAQYVSLLKDFVESEFFVIDGDSLLLMFIDKKTQYLNFFYQIECFLHDFAEKGAKYVITFFKDAEQMFFQYPHFLFLRTALIEHLRHNTSITVHTEFSNCLSSKWEIFLKQSYPYFIIVSDTGLSPRQRDFLSILIAHSLSKKINVVLASGQEYDLLRVYGYHVQSVYKHRSFFQMYKQDLRCACENLVSYKEPLIHLYEHLKLNLKSIQKEVYQAIRSLKQLWPEGSDIRRVVCVLACAVGLKIYSSMLGNANTSMGANGMQSARQRRSKHLSPEEAADLCRMQCLTVTFLLHMPLSQRAQIRDMKCCWTKQVLPLLKMQQLCMHFALVQLCDTNDWKLDLTYLPDLYDDSLLINLAHYYEVEYTKGLEFQKDLGKEMENDYQFLWDAVKKLAVKYSFGDAFPIRKTSQVFLEQEQTLFRVCEEEIPNIGLIPMKSDLVQDYVGDVLKDLPVLKSNDPAITSLIKYKEFDERHHWHSDRPLTEEYERVQCSADAKSKSPKERREIQKLQTFRHFYGSTLDDSPSKHIVYQEHVSKNANSAVKKAQKKHKSKVEIITEENNRRLRAKEENKEQKQWQALYMTTVKEIKENQTVGINKLEKFLKTFKSKSVKFSIEMTALSACLQVWKKHCKEQGNKSKDLSKAVQVMRRIHILLEKYQDLLEESHLQKLTKYLKLLGFENLACSLSGQTEESSNQNTSKYAIEVGSARFQLQYMDYYLLREERNDPDPRVQHFIPDTWQRELLDAVDNNESAVIVAPTSSGKTYASYYCMEKVLKTSNDGVVVYVAPTKALVNQVVGTVYSRFTKKLPDGLAVCGVFTRDYRHDVMNSQILVTVPQCLEILMLSPRCQKWTQRIQYVIFDEVHCLGGEIGAEIWEHLLITIRCPFLALSATVSNPEYLTEWLQSVKRYWQCAENKIKGSSTNSEKNFTRQCKVKSNVREQKKSYRVRLVLYEERYNDLEKYVCSLKGSDFTIEHCHPCAALTVNHIENYGIPSDLSLSPRESIQLYDTMAKVWQDWPRAQELDPEEFVSFKNKVVIKKADARKYEQELKKELSEWIVLGQRQKVNELLEHLKPKSVDCSEQQKWKHFANFVDKLHEMDKLPAIFFIFNIHLVERAAMTVFSKLLEKQKSIQGPDPEREKEHLREKLRKVTKMLAKLPEDTKKLSPQKMKSMELLSTKKTNLEIRLKTLTTIPSVCTYADHKAVDEDTLRKIFHRLRFERRGYLQQMMALRGIGYHHASMSAKQRQVVEMLFRLGYVKVVTATSSLALGINMPCKSVVFAEDSVFLDALNYRQMSGRAGRRGQDMIGNVFFYDIPLPKVERLIKSNVPQLKGQFPLTISLILRLMLLAAKADDKADARAKALSVLKHSLMSFRKERYAEILKIYFVFSLQFLIKEGYLDQECNPVGFAGLVTHLYYHEPSNFVLVSFLVKGLLHKLCQPIKDSTVFSEDVMEKLVLILANLFGRMYLPACSMKYKRQFSQSKVFLEDLPEDFADALNEYNTKVQQNFAHFLLTTAKLADMEQEYKLPLSKTDFTSQNWHGSELASYLMDNTKSISAISPFACLSGVVDNDLFHGNIINKAVLRSLGVNVTNCPLLYLNKYDNQGRRRPLNAYALDFYKHGSLTALTTDNWLNEGDAYYALKDFSLLIKSVGYDKLVLFRIQYIFHFKSNLKWNNDLFFFFSQNKSE